MIIGRFYHSMKYDSFTLPFGSQDEVNEWKTFYKYRYVVKLLEPVPKEYVYKCSLFVLLNVVYCKKKKLRLVGKGNLHSSVPPIAQITEYPPLTFASNVWGSLCLNYSFLYDKRA